MFIDRVCLNDLLYRIVLYDILYRIVLYDIVSYYFAVCLYYMIQWFYANNFYYDHTWHIFAHMMIYTMPYLLLLLGDLTHLLDRLIFISTYELNFLLKCIWFSNFFCVVVLILNLLMSTLLFHFSPLLFDLFFSFSIRLILLIWISFLLIVKPLFFSLLFLNHTFPELQRVSNL